MNAPLPRQRGRCICHDFLLRSMLFIVLSHNVSRSSHAYSTSPSIERPLSSSSLVLNDIDRTPIQYHPFPKDNSAELGRRTFFRRSTAALTSITATTVTTSAIHPQAAQAASSKTSIPTLGSPAPEFSLLNSRGKMITLDSLTADQNKWTVLYFYPGAFTSGCTIEARRFQEDVIFYRKLNAQVVGVSVDSVAKNSEFCTSEGLDFFMLTDEGGKVSKSYGTALSIPGFGTFSNRQTYIIDPKKNVRWVFVDVESRIPKHSSDVLAKLQELQQDT